MVNRFKKYALAFALIFGIQSAIPHQAHAYAAAGAAIAGSGGLAGVLAIAGASVVGFSIIGGVGGIFTQTDVRVVSLFGILLYVGLVILPAEGSTNIDLAKLNAKKAESLGVDREQMDRYNAELPQINLINQEIAAAILSGKISTGHQIGQAWKAYRDHGDISEKAFFVLEKVSAQVAQKLSQQL